MNKYYILFLIIFCAACSSTKVSFDYDSQVDFSKYKTYDFFKDSILENIGALDKTRILRSAEEQITSKGLTKADNPDLLIDIHIKTKNKVDVSATTSGGYGRYGYRYGGGYSTTQVNYDEYTEGTIIVTFVDSDTKSIVWSGRGTKTLSENVKPEKKDANINFSMQQIFNNYPPK